MQSRRTIYLDHSATTPVHPAVVEAMLPYFSEIYGNPSSIHRAGRRAQVALTQARTLIADVLGAKPAEILFTSGGSEGDNMALRGIALARRAASGANCILISAVEHHAVLHTAEDLRDHFGFRLTVLPVDHEGRVDPATVEQSLGDGQDVALVSVMYANNEVGTIQPISEIGALCRARGVPLHTDAVQAVGKLPLSVNDLQVDALSTSAHKFYGPKGAGFLYLRQGTPFWPVQTGGSHEHNRRAGTENVPLIVGTATALALVEGEREPENARLRVLRDQLIGGILETVDGAQLTGARAQRLSCHASFVISGVEAEGVLIALDLAGVAASSGSACTSAAQQPSHVLQALGIPPADAVGGLRLTLGHSNTPDDVTYVLANLPRIVAQIRGAEPVAL
jgi:cysteine desulfurase